jgi:hypothetical protein
MLSIDESVREEVVQTMSRWTSMRYDSVLWRFGAIEEKEQRISYKQTIEPSG